LIARYSTEGGVRKGTRRKRKETEGWNRREYRYPQTMAVQSMENPDSVGK
jgi:hypothetical protein